MNLEKINILQTILKEKNQNFRNLVDNFLKWYFFFWTLNVTGIAGIYTGLKGINISEKHLITVLFIIINILAFTISIVTLIVAIKISNESVEISNEISRFFEKIVDAKFIEALIKPPYPKEMIYFGFPSTTISFLPLLAFWAYLSIN